MLYRRGSVLCYCAASQIHHLHDGQSGRLYAGGSLDGTYPDLIFAYILGLVHDRRAPQVVGRSSQRMYLTGKVNCIQIQDTT